MAYNIFRLFRFLFRTRTCIPDGCGLQVETYTDHKCVICRLPMGEKK